VEITVHEAQNTKTVHRRVVWGAVQPVRRCPFVAVALFALVLVAGCAGSLPVPEPADGSAASPQVGWVIMSGDAENPDRDFVCQSNPRSECVIPADGPDARVRVHVHFYYHAAAVETKYTGAIQIGFFDPPHEINPNSTVKPGASPGNHSVSDFVTGKPGTYPMTIAVVAASTQTGETQNIRDQVSVTVR
jgi:hypothetical protein